MKPIQVGLLGIGTVGSGVFTVLARNQEEIQRRAGRGIRIHTVADLNTQRAQELVQGQAQVVSDARTIIQNPEIDIVVELIGGYGIAKDLVLEAIAHGKHVVTANKALIAVHGNEQLGYRIKLLGITKKTPSGIELRVHPTLVPAKRLLANVEGAMNAVQVFGDAVGTTLYYGKGAGSEPTASAVIADLVDVTRLQTADSENRVPHLAFQPNALQNTPILPISEVTTSYYLRLAVADQAGVLADITRILAAHGVSIDALLQKEAPEGESQTDLVILTHETKEKNMTAALLEMQNLKTVIGEIVKIRLENLS
ncbi:MAG: homoserine dehydrogenase [Burkholderiaceae bacterium]|nr:homoserine dehydrogenase [Burkholderiaceae bacterium]